MAIGFDRWGEVCGVEWAGILEFICIGRWESLETMQRYTRSLTFRGQHEALLGAVVRGPVFWRVHQHPVGSALIKSSASR